MEWKPKHEQGLKRKTEDESEKTESEVSFSEGFWMSRFLRGTGGEKTIRQAGDVYHPRASMYGMCFHFPVPSKAKQNHQQKKCEFDDARTLAFFFSEILVFFMFFFSLDAGGQFLLRRQSNPAGFL